MSAQHTPGPWWATVGNRGTLCVISGEAWICGELSNGNGERPGEAEANARLIAAAPDMLAALREAQAALAMMTAPEAIKATSVQHAFAQAVAAEAKARAAISKAEGRS